MTTMLIFWVVLTALAGASFVAHRAYNARLEGRLRALPAPAKAPGVLELEVDDAVVIMGDSYSVVGVLLFEDSGKKWRQYRIDGGGQRRWLRAIRADGVVLSLLDELDQSIAPDGADTLTHDGNTYTLKMRRKARVEHSGDTGRSPADRCETFDYEGTGGRLLSLERWGASWQGLAGARISQGQVEVLARSRNA